MQINSFQIVSALIVSVIGFAFRLGLEYEEKKRMPNFWSFMVLFFFSFGVAALVFLWVIEKEWTPTFKLIPIWAGSFFGIMIVRGFGSIKGDFFAGLLKDWMRKWVNNENKHNYESDSEISKGTEVSETQQDGEDMEQ